MKVGKSKMIRLCIRWSKNIVVDQICKNIIINTVSHLCRTEEDMMFIHIK